MTEKWVKSKGIETRFELAGLFELSEFELPGSTVFWWSRNRGSSLA